MKHLDLIGWFFFTNSNLMYLAPAGPFNTGMQTLYMVMAVLFWVLGMKYER
jgi:hypothetical protein